MLFAGVDVDVDAEDSLCSEQHQPDSMCNCASHWQFMTEISSKKEGRCMKESKMSIWQVWLNGFQRWQNKRHRQVAVACPIVREMHWRAGISSWERLVGWGSLYCHRHQETSRLLNQSWPQHSSPPKTGKKSKKNLSHWMHEGGDYSQPVTAHSWELPCKTEPWEICQHSVPFFSWEIAQK